MATSDTAPLLQTGIVGLDDILGGGFMPNRLYLVEGDPGAGKTTLGLQVLLASQARGESCIYVTLSETKEELDAVAVSHGWTLADVVTVELGPTEENLTWDSENTMFHPSEVELSEVTRKVLREVERLEPRLVVFDSLSEMRLMAQNPLRYRRQILALKQFFSGRHCTVLLLDDRTSDTTDLQLQSIAHGVVSLERRAPEYGVMQRRLQVLKMRGKAFRTGFHDFIIGRGGLEVFPRLVAAEHRESFPATQVKSGIVELDAIMGGGIDQGTSTLVMGPAGVGKSTIATQFAIAAARRGERAALFLFDESTRTHLLRSASLGIDLATEFDAGRIAIRQVDPGELSPGEFVHLVRSEVEEHNTRVIVIDSLNGYLNAMPEVRFLNLQLHELLTYLGQRGVTTLLILAQHGLVGTLSSSPVDLSYLADSVVALQYFEAHGHVRQTISVLKKRSGPHERTLRELRLGDGQIRVGQPLVEFQGILSGVPSYLGDAPLLKLHGVDD